MNTLLPSKAETQIEPDICLCVSREPGKFVLVLFLNHYYFFGKETGPQTGPQENEN